MQEDRKNKKERKSKKEEKKKTQDSSSGEKASRCPHPYGCMYSGTNKNNHPFQLVDKRPWPIIGAIGTLIMITGLIKWFHLYKQELILIEITIIILTSNAHKTPT